MGLYGSQGKLMGREWMGAMRAGTWGGWTGGGCAGRWRGVVASAHCCLAAAPSRFLDTPTPHMANLPHTHSQTRGWPRAHSSSNASMFTSSSSA